MMDNKSIQNAATTKNGEETLVFEIVNKEENIVKAISYQNGKKQEVFFYALPEDEFDALIPSSEKESTNYKEVSAG
jgi:hypothetical protein